jgi:hypothetical protein
MRGVVALILGIGLAANGSMMLAVPSAWYAIMPGVAATGPFNPHFIRDIGVAYSSAGRRWSGLRWTGLPSRPRSPLRRSSRCTPSRICGTPPPAASTRISCSSTSPRYFCRRFWRSGSRWRQAAGQLKDKGSTMIKWFLRRWIDKFERTWNYDASYLREVLDADPRALIAFGKVSGIGSYRKGVPPAAYCAAGIVGTMTEDCGPAPSS